MDIAIQEYGRPEGALQLFLDNDLSFDQDIVSNTALSIQTDNIPVYAAIKPAKQFKPQVNSYYATVTTNQMLADVCLNEYGSIEALIDLALDNNLTLDSEVSPGDKLIIFTSKVRSQKVKDYLSQTNKRVNTGETVGSGAPPESGGIGFMIIEETFIVS